MEKKLTKEEGYTPHNPVQVWADGSYGECSATWNEGSCGPGRWCCVDDSWKPEVNGKKYEGYTFCKPCSDDKTFFWGSCKEGADEVCKRVEKYTYKDTSHNKRTQQYTYQDNNDETHLGKGKPWNNELLKQFSNAAGKYEEPVEKMATKAVMDYISSA